jgi:glucokinase
MIGRDEGEPMSEGRDSHVMVGIDVGATSVSGGLVTGEGEILMATTAATGPRQGTAVETVLGVIDDVVAHAARLRRPLAGVGIGLPGLVDARRGMMVNAGNLLPEFADVPLAEHVRSRTGLWSFVDNDVNVLALGEWMFGLGRGATSFVLLALGTGPGGGIIVGDTLVRGHAGGAGEFGHVCVDVDGPPCMCGARGCVGVYLGGFELARRAREAALGEPGSRLLARAGGEPAKITPPLIFAAAADGDLVAGRLAAEACRALGAAIGCVVNTLNPEIVVVTGGVMTGLISLEGEVRRHAASYALGPLLATTRLYLVPGDKQRTVRGGAALVRYELDRRERDDPRHVEATHLIERGG